MRIYLLKRKGQLSKENQEKGRSKKVSLYLMYHFGKGRKREYEFLNLQLFDKPKTQLERDHNKQTLQLAETIKAKKQVDLQTTSHGFVSSVKGDICFVAYFKTIVDKKFDSGSDHNWFSAYKHLQDFTNGREMPIKNIDDRFLELFKEYLLTCKTRKGKPLTKLNRNSAQSYFNKVRAALKQAYFDKMIKENPALRVTCIKGQESHRDFLTIEEIRKLYNTDCEIPVLKKAFLFECMTGLRFSDSKALKWNNIMYSEKDGYSIKYTQKKTSKAEVLPVAEHVIRMLGIAGQQDELIFEGLQYSSQWNQILSKWLRKAGITKKITHHNARHSYAVLQISAGTDIYTVSKLLGHSAVKTTQIYAKVIDSKKIEAANRIPELFC